MWLELSEAWINTDHLVRVEFTNKGLQQEAVQPCWLKATLITIKPGGSDRTFVYNDDASKLQTAINQLANVNVEKEKKKTKKV